MEEIIEKLKSILKKYKFLHEYSWADRYFMQKKTVKKLVFYFYVKNEKYVVFGLSIQWTAILENYPMLKVACDESGVSTLRWKIFSLDDIEKKWISNIVQIVAESFGVLS